MMKIQPMEDRVLLQLRETDQTSSGGLYIPDTAQPTFREAVVEAVGPGRTENGAPVTMTVQEGDCVLFDTGQSAEVSFNGIQYFIVRERDLLGVLHEN